MAVENILAAPTPGGLAQPSAEANGRRRLTRQQARVVVLVACGLSDDDIARILCISHATVDWHIKLSCGRLRVHSRAALVARAIFTAEIALADWYAVMQDLGKLAGEGGDCEP